MSEALDKVKRLKISASSNRKYGRFVQALRDINEAIDILQHEYDDLSSQQLVGLKEYEKSLRRELADCYGIAGGLYRRKAGDMDHRKEMLEKSEEMYRKGLKYEEGDSYNLVNSLVIPILINPANLEAQKDKMKHALEIVQEQVHGKRRDQWWAWSDFGLLNLLVGRMSEALGAYARIKLTGAGPDDFDSTIAVLSQLNESFGDETLPISVNIRMAIECLRNTKP